MSNGNGGGPTTTTQVYKVELPSGGPLHLQSDEEVELWSKSHARYIEDYQLTKLNDLVLLGAILQQQVIVFRAQRRINGMKPEIDGNGLPTGRYIMEELDADQMSAAVSMMTKATQEITRIEKALGIDKVTRESGGAHSLDQYLRTLKSAAHLRGVHITKRTLAYEKFVNELRWRIRGLRNWDAEDRSYHNLTPETVLDWCWEQLTGLEQVDKDFAREKGKLFVGKL